jgi:hypothetical protein
MTPIAELGFGLSHAFPLLAEHDLSGKPVSTPAIQVRAGFFRIKL